MKPPYTTEPEYKPITLLQLALDIVYAVAGAGVIVGGLTYYMGVWN